MQFEGILRRSSRAARINGASGIDSSRPCMEKTLISVEEFPIPEAGSRQKDKRKRCVFCGNLASHEAVFKVKGASVVERYCSLCVKGLK
jgi:hypothetical protein